MELAKNRRGTEIHQRSHDHHRDPVCAAAILQQECCDEVSAGCGRQHRLTCGTPRLRSRLPGRPRHATRRMPGRRLASGGRPSSCSRRFCSRGCPAWAASFITTILPMSSWTRRPPTQPRWQAAWRAGSGPFCDSATRQTISCGASPQPASSPQTAQPETRLSH